MKNLENIVLCRNECPRETNHKFIPIYPLTSQHPPYVKQELHEEAANFFKCHSLQISTQKSKEAYNSNFPSCFSYRS